MGIGLCVGLCGFIVVVGLVWCLFVVFVGVLCVDFGLLLCD